MPAVWISDTKLMYITEYLQVRVLDVVSHKISGSWPDGILPTALSPDGKTVLCTTRDPSSISLYGTDGRRVDTIKKSAIFFDCHLFFVWSSDGRSFIYTRRRNTFSFTIADAPVDAYMFNLDTRQEKRIMSNVNFWGGFSLGPAKTPPAGTGSDSEPARPAPRP